eukprot:350468-Chlamydomonas_euryale.AAC.5
MHEALYEGRLPLCGCIMCTQGADDSYAPPHSTHSTSTQGGGPVHGMEPCHAGSPYTWSGCHAHARNQHGGLVSLGAGLVLCRDVPWGGRRTLADHRCSP